MLSSRQGYGWSVIFSPVKQSLGRFSTIEEQLSELGLKAERKVLSSKRVTGAGRILEVLGPGEYLEVERLNLANTIPFARVTVWVPARLGEAYSISDYEVKSFYELLSESEILVQPLDSARQSIAAIPLSPHDAGLLDAVAGSPALFCERITYDSSGKAVLLSNSVFPGTRTEFVTELTSQTSSIAPSGLRLLKH